MTREFLFLCYYRNKDDISEEGHCENTSLLRRCRKRISELIFRPICRGTNPFMIVVTFRPGALCNNPILSGRMC